MTDIQVEFLNIIQSHFTVIILFFMGYISKYNIKRFPFMITDRFTKQNSSLIVIAFTVILIYSLYNFMVTGFIVILFLFFLFFWGGANLKIYYNLKVIPIMYIKQPHIKLFCARTLLSITYIYASKYRFIANVSFKQILNL